MPELPEVETVRRTLEGEVLGKSIEEVLVFRATNIHTNPKQFPMLLQGKKIESLDRKGKLLIFHFSDGLTMLTHLRMEGKYYFYQCAHAQEKHDIFAFCFDGGSSLVYNDTRKFGFAELYEGDDWKKAESYTSIGDEPFDIDPKALLQKYRKKARPVKESLLDQTIMAGLGNIYADEVLFATSLHPLTPSNRLDEKKAEEIVEASKRILNDAIDMGGSTIHSYHPGLGIDGKMQSRLLVYGREFEPCVKCGKPLRRIKISGRSSTFCPRCQKDPEAPYILGVTGPIHSGKSSVSKFFEEKGYIVFDADKVAKEAYCNQSIREKLISAFGDGVYVNENPDFAFIRNIVSADKKARLKLNSIIHPYVKDKALQLIASKDAKSKIVLDVPLLVDGELADCCNDIILVEASLEARRQRLLEEGKDADKLLSLNDGYPVERAKKYASFALKNDGNLEDLTIALNQIYKELNQA